MKIICSGIFVGVRDGPTLGLVNNNRFMAICHLRWNNTKHSFTCFDSIEIRGALKSSVSQCNVTFWGSSISQWVSAIHIAGQGLRIVRRPQAILALAAGQALGTHNMDWRGVKVWTTWGGASQYPSSYWSVNAMVGNLPNKLPVQQTEQFNISVCDWGNLNSQPSTLQFFMAGGQISATSVKVWTLGGTRAHTWYLSFFLHWQNFWRIKFTPKNANFSR